jgi:hypothetical protein
MIGWLMMKKGEWNAESGFMAINMELSPKSGNERP